MLSSLRNTQSVVTVVLKNQLAVISRWLIIHTRLNAGWRICQRKRQARLIQKKGVFKAQGD